MKIKISNIKILLNQSIEDYTKKLNIDKYRVVRKSIDARDKANIFYNYAIVCDIDDSLKHLLKMKNVVVIEKEIEPLTYPKWNKKYRPVLVGFGPASIFCALYLARCNANPIIIERGSKIEDRVKEVELFINDKVLNENSNIQFGEGGAGSFSDGKLTTNVKDPLVNFILQEFVNYGAPEEVMYDSMPHIGTDYLRDIVKNIREDIKSLGGEFYFNHIFTDYKKFNEYVEVNVVDYNNNLLKFETDHLILGFGHSARDTIKMLHKNGLNIESKSFSMGVRVEHKRETINKIQYGKAHKQLPAATYKLAVHLENRSVYSFCMCPGGFVMASQNEKNSIVTNGMSNHLRDNVNSNSAILCNIDPIDYYKDSVLDGMYYQEKYEKLAFDISKDYKAPANLMKEFLVDKVAIEQRSVKTSYPHGLCFTDFKKCLPSFVVDSIKQSIPLLNRKMNGFYDEDAILVGVETRSSSPIRLLRDSTTRQSNCCCIYPIGEGAGYAGGITSACVDGLKTAICIAGK